MSSRLAIAAAAVGLLAPATASATVSSTVSESSTGLSLTVTGSEIADAIDVSCDHAARVQVNGLRPPTDADPTEPGSTACADITAIGIDGGGGNDRIDLRAVSPESGFSSTALCGPCPGGSYSIVAECLAGGGDDTITTSRIGTLVGGCAGMRSMTGNDTVIGRDGDDAIAAGPGRDIVRSGRGNDQLFGGPDEDFLLGGAGDDLVVGKQGDDKLSGSAGDDRLAGGPGFDAMRGGVGTDSCIGGPDRAKARGCEFVRGA